MQFLQALNIELQGKVLDRGITWLNNGYPRAIPLVGVDGRTI
jgi:hypothetical protein